MSAGKFARLKYEASYDSTQIHPIRVQPETRDAVIGGTQNFPPSGAATNPISAVVSGSKRTKGLTPRKVTLEFSGEVPTGYAEGAQVTIPCLSVAFYVKCLVTGATGTYLGKPVSVVSTSAESVK